MVLPAAVVEARRAAVRCLSDGRKVSTDDEAARYVDERGFVPIMGLAGCPLPSLSEAGVRPPREGFISDDAWRWKEVLPQQKRCAYGRFLRQRGFFLSWRLFPAFYRLYRRPALQSQAPDFILEDWGHSQDYAAGLLSRQEWQVLATIAERGPIDSRQLWNLSQTQDLVAQLAAAGRLAEVEVEGWQGTWLWAI